MPDAADARSRDGAAAARDLDALLATPRWLAWIETAALAAAPALVGLCLRPADPLFVRATFPWPVLAPLLAGLRYGFAHGLGCALALVAAVAARSRLDGTPLPGQLSVALVIVGMLAGEVADQWSRRLRRIARAADHRRDRLDELARAFHVLHLSHDQLEQRLAGAGHSLRESLSSLRRELAREPLDGVGDRLLALLTGFGFVQRAALHAVDPGGRLRTVAAARLGEACDVDPADALVVEALSRRALVSVRAEAPSRDRPTALVAALPLADVHGRVHALVAIHDMHFIAFHDDNLRMLAVVGGHLGDLLGAALDGAPAAAATPLERLERELARSIADRRAHDLPSALLRIDPLPPHERLVATELSALRRGLDELAEARDADGRATHLLLLPLTSPLGVEGYLARLALRMRERFGCDLEEVARVAVHTVDVADEAAALTAAVLARDAPRAAASGEVAREIGAPALQRALRGDVRGGAARAGQAPPTAAPGPPRQAGSSRAGLDEAPDGDGAPRR